MGLIDSITDKLTGGHTGAIKRLNAAQVEEFKNNAGRVPSSADLAGMIDPADPLPGEDHAQEREHFPDEMTEKDIDTLLESINTPYHIKHGRHEDPPEDDPDDSPEDDGSEDEDYPD